jgi:hypothetical protein
VAPRSGRSKYVCSCKKLGGEIHVSSAWTPWCTSWYHEQPKPEPDEYEQQVIRETAYFSWERAGRPEGYTQDHWERAIIEASNGDIRGRDDEFMQDEEKVLAGRPDANMPALLTKDVPGGRGRFKVPLGLGSAGLHMQGF